MAEVVGAALSCEVAVIAVVAAANVVGGLGNFDVVAHHLR